MCAVGSVHFKLQTQLHLNAKGSACMFIEVLTTRKIIYLIFNSFKLKELICHGNEQGGANAVVIPRKGNDPALCTQDNNSQVQVGHLDGKREERLNC